MMEVSDNVSAQRAELGQRLRTARETQNISLEEAEEATRIRQRYLEQIESGDFDDLPGDVIARGFIRNYATFLGQDTTELFSVYRRVLPLPAPGSEWQVPDETPKWRLEQKAVDVDLGRRTIPYARIGGMAAFVVVVAFLAWQAYLRIPGLVQALTTPDPRPTATATQTFALVGSSTATPDAGTGEPDPTSAVPAQNPATPTPTRPVATATSQPEPTATLSADTPATDTTGVTAPASGVEAVVRISGGRSWMEVTADGNVIQTGTLLDPDTEMTWSAVQWLRVDIGNAGAVDVTVNGMALGIQGEDQQVVRRVWYLNGTEILMYDVNPDGTPLSTPIPLTLP